MSKNIGWQYKMASHVQILSVDDQNYLNKENWKWNCKRESEKWKSSLFFCNFSLSKDIGRRQKMVASVQTMPVHGQTSIEPRIDCTPEPIKNFYQLLYFFIHSYLDICHWSFFTPETSWVLSVMRLNSQQISSIIMWKWNLQFNWP